MNGGQARKRGMKMAYIIERYNAAHPEQDGAALEPHKIAPWAIKQGLWSKPPLPPEEILRRELSRHFKNQFIEDPQGRLVRERHAVPIKVTMPDGVKNMSEWYKIFETPPQKFAISTQLRRRQTARDAIQLSFDIDSYNDNNLFGATVQSPDFNLNKDVAESKMPSTYDPEPPKDDDANPA